MFSHQILELFQKGEKLYLEFGMGYLHIFMGAMFVNDFSALAANFFASIGKAKEEIVTSLSRQVIFQLSFILMFSLIWRIDGVLYAGPIADCLVAILCAILVKKVLKKWGGEQ